MFCFLRQWRISSALDDGRTIPVGLLRHTERCERCRAFLAMSRKLDAALRAEAHTLAGGEPPAPDAAAHSGVPTPMWRLLAPSAAAAILLAIGLSLWLGGSGQPPRDVAQHPPPVQPVPPADQAQPAIPDPFRLEPLAEDWLVKLERSGTESMKREIAGLTSDAEAAMSSLLSHLR